MLPAHRLRPTLLVLSILGAGPAHAFSLGAPICEVQALPLAPMSPTLASPAPTGWQLRIDAPRYIPGRPVRVAVTNTDLAQRARGVLLWAKSGPVTGFGSFVVDNALWQHLPGSANCGEWAITHTSNAAKPLDQLHFEWIAPAAASASVLFRAFVIEDCDDPQGCRSYQALTPVTVLQAGLFFDDFEPGG